MYFKITNKKEKHHGYQYYNGLNILKSKFQPEGNCVPGGLYFSDGEHICDFLEFGIYIRQVTLPEDKKKFKMVKIGDTKWRANQIILGKRRDLRKVSTWKYLQLIKINLHDHIDNIVEFAIKYKKPKILRYMLVNSFTCLVMMTICSKIYDKVTFYLIKKIFKKKIPNETIQQCLDTLTSITHLNELYKIETIITLLKSLVDSNVVVSATTTNDDINITTEVNNNNITDSKKYILTSTQQKIPKLNLALLKTVE